MTYYTGKRAFITGGSSGIGLALAKQLAGAGAQVTILGRDQAKLDAACQEITALRSDPSQQVMTIAADVADQIGVTQALMQYVQANGAPDVLINSAGITRPGLFM